MAKKLTPHVRQRLIEVGEALDIDKQLAVGFGGEVSIHEEYERSEDAERECEGPAGGQGSQRRSGQSQGPRQAGPGASPRLRGDSLEAHYLSGKAEVLERYQADFTFTQFGLWVVAPSSPLGCDGPQFQLAVFLPTRAGAKPTAWGWALHRLGKFPKFVGPRHTNFPFHDICAQGPECEAWGLDDGVRPLLNLYSTWLLRHCFLNECSRWPGRQWGATALYRRTEFLPEEWCGCGQTARYGECCMEADRRMTNKDAETEHLRIMKAPYGPRVPPRAVKAFARSGFVRVPEHPFVGDPRFR